VRIFEISLPPTTRYVVDLPDSLPLLSGKNNCRSSQVKSAVIRATRSEPFTPFLEPSPAVPMEQDSLDPCLAQGFR